MKQSSFYLVLIVLIIGGFQFSRALQCIGTDNLLEGYAPSCRTNSNLANFNYTQSCMDVARSSSTSTCTATTECAEVNIRLVDGVFGDTSNKIWSFSTCHSATQKDIQFCAGNLPATTPAPATTPVNATTTTVNPASATASTTAAANAATTAAANAATTAAAAAATTVAPTANSNIITTAGSNVTFNITNNAASTTASGNRRRRNAATNSNGSTTNSNSIMNATTTIDSNNTMNATTVTTTALATTSNVASQSTAAATAGASAAATTGATAAATAGATAAGATADPGLTSTQGPNTTTQALPSFTGCATGTVSLTTCTDSGQTVQMTVTQSDGTIMQVEAIVDIVGCCSTPDCRPDDPSNIAKTSCHYEDANGMSGSVDCIGDCWSYMVVNGTTETLYRGCLDNMPLADLGSSYTATSCTEYYQSGVCSTVGSSSDEECVRCCTSDDCNEAMQRANFLNQADGSSGEMVQLSLTAFTTSLLVKFLL